MAEPIDNGGPAFPVELARMNMATGENVQVESDPGLSRRDYFAAKALNGILSDDGMRPTSVEETHHLARRCYDMADAMIAASKEPRHG